MIYLLRLLYSLSTGLRPRGRLAFWVWSVSGLLAPSSALLLTTPVDPAASISGTINSSSSLSSEDYTNHFSQNQNKFRKKKTFFAFKSLPVFCFLGEGEELEFPLGRWRDINMFFLFVFWDFDEDQRVERERRYFRISNRFLWDHWKSEANQPPYSSPTRFDENSWIKSFGWLIKEHVGSCKATSARKEFQSNGQNVQVPKAFFIFFSPLYLIWYV